MELDAKHRTGRRRAALLFLPLVLLGGVTAAVAADSAGTGDALVARRTASPAATLARVRNASARDGLVVGGRVRGALHPGGAALPVDLVFTNRRGVAVTITTAAVHVAGASADGCDAGAFAVVQQLRAAPVVAARSTRSLSALGVPVASWPQLRMRDDGDQSACEGATLRLSFSATAAS